jgi:hypothetical protein
MPKINLLTMTATLLAAMALPAHAGVPRAWVSGHGTDATGCGAPTDPCRSLQYVHDNIIAAGGEIDILDPAGYGAITITKAISIINDGVGTAGVQATSGNAITINAGLSDSVALRGLSIAGLGTGTNGIVFNSGGSLDIADCIARNFTNDGININLSAGGSNNVFLTMRNVAAKDNGFAGIEIQSNLNLYYQLSQIEASHNGLSQEGAGLISNATFGNGSVVDSVFGANYVGIEVKSDAVALNRVTGYANLINDLSITNAGHVFLVNNNFGTVSNGNAAYTFGNNAIDGVSGNALQSRGLQ